MNRIKRIVKKMSHILPDGVFILLRFRMRMGKWPNLKVPKTFNEKLQWLKLNERKPQYTQMVDKYGVREYIKEKIGEDYLIPLVGGPWKNVEEIDFDNLPEKFVMKCTHDSGGLIICKDKSRLDYDGVTRKIKSSLVENYYWQGREWPYKNVEPRIIAEMYMKDGDNENLPVYKFFCFNGEPKIVQTIQNDKQPNETIDYFDMEWNLLNMKQNFPNSPRPLKRPVTLEKMIELAYKLSAGLSFVRVDFYEINGRVYFSEYTFYSDGGTAKFEPPSWDEVLGEWIELPK